jgi:hypothetical protein
VREVFRLTAFAMLVSLIAACGALVSFDEYGTSAHRGGPDGSTDLRHLYGVQGRVTGVGAGREVTLVLGKAASIAVGDGSFEFPAVIADGADFAVSVGAQPVARVCSVLGGTGRIAHAPALGIVVSCSPVDATLASLSLDIGDLVPAFSPATLAYAAVLRRGTRSTTLSARPVYEGATVDVTSSSSASTSATGAIAVEAGPTRIELLVTAPDHVTQLRYVVVVTVDGDRYFKASNPRAGALFGSAVAIDGDLLVVGAPGEASAAIGSNGDQKDVSAPEAGAVYVYRRIGLSWSQQAYLKASNTRAGARFGRTVAISGSTIVVGSELEPGGSSGVGGDQGDTSMPGAGAVYVFTPGGSSWAQQAYLKASNTRAGAHFGASVAIYGDTIAIGAPGESSSATGVGGNDSDSSAPGAGASYVFARSGVVWSQQAYVKASNTRPAAKFGAAVALTSDHLAVGSPGETGATSGIGGSQADGGVSGAGAAYVFLRAGTSWSQDVYLKPTPVVASGAFGSSIALSRGVVTIGSPGSQAVQGFQFYPGFAWGPFGTVSVGGVAEIAFGAAVANDVSMSGNYVGFVGAPREDADALAVAAGSVYVASSSLGDGRHASNARANALYGSSVAYSAVSTTLAIGSPGESSGASGVDGNRADTSMPNSGAVYVY